MKKSAVVICPGRGTYNREELGYLSKYHRDKGEFISAMDGYRRDQHQMSISDLDSADVFRMKSHSTGDNASALIYTCAMSDFLSINRKKYDIVAVTGNSMGWYLALTAGGAANLNQGMHIVNTMGTLMDQKAEGGQLIFPLCNENWQYDPELKRQLDECMVHASQNYQVFNSIDLGLVAVVAGESDGINDLLKTLPRTQQRFPMVLPHHAAFHTPLMKSISEQGKKRISKDILSIPTIPLIDGRGHIWQPYSSDKNDLYEYTFDHQVCQTYDYSKAVEVACKEFAPDCLIILGPGSSLGAPTAQQLIKMRWHDIADKESFKITQNKQPFILSMGIEDQRKLVTT